MKLCNAEIMKKIKELNERKRDILAEESRVCATAYLNESDKISGGYSFEQTRESIEALNSEVRYLKRLLSEANVTVTVEEFGMTVGECLVYMGQLNDEKLVLEEMSGKEAKQRRTLYNGTVEYTEIEYDIEACRRKYAEVKNTISKLQLAIDRTNLTTMTEV